MDTIFKIMATSQLYVPTRPAAFAFELGGKPEAQPRSGSRQNRRYNPKEKLILSARVNERDMPLFPSPRLLSVEVVFHWPRPRTHMAPCGCCVLERFKHHLVKCFPRKKVDVDNLAKYILDVMTGPVYSDDSQIVKLTVIKIHDDEDTCQGRTEVKLTEIVSLDQLNMN